MEMINKKQNATFALHATHTTWRNVGCGWLYGFEDIWEQ